MFAWHSHNFERIGLNLENRICKIWNKEQYRATTQQNIQPILKNNIDSNELSSKISKLIVNTVVCSINTPIKSKLVKIKALVEPTVLSRVA